MIIPTETFMLKTSTTRGVLRRASLGFAAVSALTLAACGGGADTVRLTGAGATFPYPVYSKWFDAFYNATGHEINYQSIGSGAGVRQFTEGTVDFGATDGPMTDESTPLPPAPSTPTIPTSASINLKRT